MTAAETIQRCNAAGNARDLHAIAGSHPGDLVFESHTDLFALAEGFVRRKDVHSD